MTAVTEFVLLELTDDLQWQIVLFIFLLVTYLLSMSGHLIITLTLIPCHCCDISYNGCVAQPFFFSIFLGVPQFHLLAAITVCILLVFSSWLAGFMIIFPPIILLLQLNFCASNIIDHFISVVTLMITLTLVTLSYTNIIWTILKIPSANQRKKAFSTCSSHMIVVSLSYGSCTFMYIKPSARERVTLRKGVAVLNTSVAPLLNLFMYTLRNQQVKQAFKSMTQRLVSSSNKWL
uniref:G-protein coupled receptors family 1 profile domain-containing protein n=1 Tax=Cavia porcellus TaxID=10141 RepID=A0A286Y5Q4_CAVPO